VGFLFLLAAFGYAETRSMPRLYGESFAGAKSERAPGIEVDVLAVS